MNKNSIVAFILIIATVALFSSPQYNKFIYEKILKRPYPEKSVQNEPKIVENKNEKEDVKKTEIIKNEKIKENSIDVSKKENEIKNDTIWVENEKIIVGIEKIGATIFSIKMKKYKHSKSNEYIEIMDEIEKGGGSITVDGKSYKNVAFNVNNSNKRIFIDSGEVKKIIFESQIDGENIKKEFEFGDSYRIGIAFKKSDLSGKRVKIDWNSGIVESEDGKENKNKNARKEIRKAHYYNGNSVQSLQMDKEIKENSTGNFKWVGISSKYFMIAMVSDSLLDADISIEGVFKDEKNKKDKTEINYKISYENTAENNESRYWIYAGPSKYEELKKYKVKFEKTLFPVIGFGRIFFWSDKWFPAVAEFILWTLLALYKIFRDYGVAILLLTLLSKIITYPLTHSSMKSMSRMKEVQPKIEKIRNKNKNNPKKLNEEIMALYREEGINPLNPGCLPMFLQMPIFIALFVVLRKAIELRGATTIILPWIGDLSKAEAIFTLPSALPMYGDNIAIMPVAMAAVTYFQNKMTIKDPNQKAMIYIMPIFMLVLFNSFPAGLVLYWTFSSTLQFVQQIITEKMKKNK